jgi:hypothetical protein
MTNTGMKKIKDLTLEDLEDFVTSLENMVNVAHKKEMREHLLLTTKKIKREIAKRLKTL